MIFVNSIKNADKRLQQVTSCSRLSTHDTLTSELSLAFVNAPKRPRPGKDAYLQVVTQDRFQAARTSLQSLDDTILSFSAPGNLLRFLFLLTALLLSKGILPLRRRPPPHLTDCTIWDKTLHFAAAYSFGIAVTILIVASLNCS